MAWKRYTARAAADLNSLVVAEHILPFNCQGAAALVFIVKGTNGNAPSGWGVERKDTYGADAYQTVSDATETGNAITGDNLAVNTSGSGIAGRCRRYQWATPGGCPFRTLKAKITGHATLNTTAVSIDVLAFFPGSDTDGQVAFAD